MLQILKNKEQMICLTGLWILVALLYFSFIQAMVPPQMGWWNYYGWQLAKGKVLYKDLYCFLPPYFIYLYEYLYKIFGNHLFLFQLLGIGIAEIIAGLMYIVFCKVLKPLYSMLAAFAGILAHVSYLILTPFDYNWVVTLFVIASFFSMAYGLLDNRKTVFASGILVGCAIVLKQTAILFFLSILFTYCYIGWQFHSKPKLIMKRLALFGGGTA